MRIEKMVLCFVVCLFIGKVNAQDSLQVSSPDGKLSYRFILNADGKIAYEVQYKQRPIILPSGLGLTKAQYAGNNWNSQFSITKTEKKSTNSVWKPVYGERSEIADKYNELVVALETKNRAGITMQIIVRAYNEGVAFKYFFPENRKYQIADIGQEETNFIFPSNSKAFFTKNAQGAYEEKALTGWTSGAELPLTLHLSNGLWACIAQADQSNFPRMRLHTVATDQLQSRLFGELTETSPFGSPWRVVMVAEKPGALLENNFIIQNLNPPTPLTNTDWIKPGKVMREMTLSTVGAKKLIDFAVEQQIDYILFDAGWYGSEYEVASDATKVSPLKSLDLKEVIAYGKARGKGVLLYVNHRAMERQLDTILPLFKSWGVAGVKYGFVHTGSHRWTTWLYDAVKKAAHYGLILDIHDEFTPTGWSRTWPNLLTQEGVRGNEEFPDATHNTILPFTRFIAGAADYTYCFNEKRLLNTKCHQLALSIINYSPLQTLYWYGRPENYTNRDEIELWKYLPTTWEETKVLDGEPGTNVTIARRKGEEWFVGAITNNDARTITIPTDFLSKKKQYEVWVYTDAEGKVSKQVTNSKDIQTFSLVAKGGVALRFIPKK